MLPTHTLPIPEFRKRTINEQANAGDRMARFDIRKSKRASGVLALVVGACLSLGQAQATVIADLRGDFVLGTNLNDPGTNIPAAGTGTWNYYSSTTVKPTPGSISPLLYQPSRTSYEYAPTQSSYAPVIGAGAPGVLADELGLHPGQTSPEFSVARWISGLGEAGPINILGNVRKADTGGAGTADGITFDIFIDGVNTFSTSLAFNDGFGVPFNLTLPIVVGSTVDFVVGRNVAWDYDGTAIKASISMDSGSTTVPEPTTFAILGLGFASLSLARRRKLGSVSRQR